MLGFVVGWGVTFTIYVVLNVRPGCDGPCLHDPWGPAITYGGGAFVALIFALAAWRLTARYFAKPS